MITSFPDSDFQKGKLRENEKKTFGPNVTETAADSFSTPRCIWSTCIGPKSNILTRGEESLVEEAILFAGERENFQISMSESSKSLERERKKKKKKKPEKRGLGCFPQRPRLNNRREERRSIVLLLCCCCCCCC